MYLIGIAVTGDDCPQVANKSVEAREIAQSAGENIVVVRRPPQLSFA